MTKKLHSLYQIRKKNPFLKKKYFFKKARSLSFLKFYTIHPFKLHKTINKSISEYFQLRIGGPFYL